MISEVTAQWSKQVVYERIEEALEKRETRRCAADDVAIDNSWEVISMDSLCDISSDEYFFDDNGDDNEDEWTEM